MTCLEQENLNYPLFNFVEPFDFEALGFGDTLLREIIRTAAFQRLRGVHFLGGIDYLLVPAPNGVRGNFRHTRYQHRLGVARLATMYCDDNDLDIRERHLVILAALLHDIGHPPLSHSLEPVFKECFGLEHHGATGLIISGRAPLGREIYTILRAFQIDVERLIALISGHDDIYDGFFAGPINFDTIEGILRTQTYAEPRLNIPGPEAVLSAAMRRAHDADKKLVDEFWGYKNLVYQRIIYSPMGILADLACQSCMRAHINDMSPDDYYTTENQLFRKLPGLFALLRSRDFALQFKEESDEWLRFRAREFFVNEDGNFYAHEDTKRYCYSHVQRQLPLKRRQSVAGGTWQLELFDEGN
jgi:hypothetical protein